MRRQQELYMQQQELIALAAKQRTILETAEFIELTPSGLVIEQAHFYLYRPEITLLFFIFWALFISVFLRNKYAQVDISDFILFLTIISFILTASIVGFNIKPEYSIIFNYTLMIDYYTSVTKLLVLMFSATLLLGSYNKIHRCNIDTIEYSILTAFSTFFILVLLSTYNLLALYLSIEGLSLTLYVLSVYPYTKSSLEAAIKYFISGAIGSGMLLFGIILCFGVIGSFDFNTIYLYTSCYEASAAFKLGVFFIILGLLFKLAMFPVHM